MKHEKDLPQNLFGPTKNDQILVEMLNVLPSITQRRNIVGQVMAFKQRANTLLYIPPTQSRMTHGLHLLQLDYQDTLSRFEKYCSCEMYPRIKGVLRTIQNSVAYRLVNSMKMLGYKDLMAKLRIKMGPQGIREEEVLAVYPYGSRVYGTARPMSDYDFIIITENTTTGEALGLSNHIHATIYSLADYQQQLRNHEISVLECMSLPREMMVKSLVHPQLEAIDVQVLRQSISAKSANSLVKAKKKIELYSDRTSQYIGLKSLFHSLRMIRFGMQVATHGRIVDYGECNELYFNMMQEPLNWPYLKEKYKALHNQWMTEFRELAPKQLPA
jgi:hypothetical protein